MLAEHLSSFSIACAVASTLLLCSAFLDAPTAYAQSDSARVAAMQKLNPRMPQPLKIDAERVRAAGISIHEGEFVTIYTDVRDSDSATEWVNVFDAAVEPWCDAFDIPFDKADDYRLSGMVMQDIARFEKCGLITPDLPKFPAGFSRGHEFWLFAQKDDYYTRHLILHEGTHAFMSWFCGSTGPPWYSEGMAEWIALHQWNGRRTRLAEKIASPDDSKGWGRIGRLQQMTADQQAMSLAQVFNIPPTAFRDVKYYAWSWAACEFLSQHPLTEQSFAQLPKPLDKSAYEFNRVLGRMVGKNLNTLERDWGVFINEIDYGYDVKATVLSDAEPMHPSVAVPTSGEARHFLVSAQRSWQSTGIEVTQGQRLRIVGRGRFVAGKTTRPWECESGGITIEYYAGQPLGKLMGCVIPKTLTDAEIAEVKAWQPFAVGLQKESLEMPADGVLFLRVNESPGHLSDNSGHLEISVFKLK